ncbi:response regulator transcription factor [Sphingomonas canadensis]|uniref:Response regulator transcription factor n=1 Tax=Sphingomonas canadensis TaxID=1219257 RepID=A0ABW3H950_9SPHN|nr:response regulator transcription factor [Sphingomonas canadensis]MCW3836566.1 response regulator transcription factor [Sphingomonas canadensis]
MWRHLVAYALLLALGTALLQWLDYRWMVRSHSTGFYLFLVAAGFLALGMVIGMRVLAPRTRPPFDGNPAAVESLGISTRELAVLRELAAGRSNREIADALRISPNTVKTHVARLYEKLGASRRTDAVARARELGIVV